MSTKPSKKRRARRPMFTQRGVALIAVTLALSGILVMASEFGTRASLDVMAAANDRDRMRAHFLAQSALDLSELVVRLQQRIDNIQQLKGIQITEFADLLMTAFGGDAEQVSDVIGSGDVKGLGADIGTFGVTISTDDDKINVNCANARGKTAEYLAARIGALYYFPVYDPIFADPDADGWRRDRDLQTAAIVDYVDLDGAKLSQPGSPEDYGYDNLKDTYGAKNNYIDTVGEIRQIRGIDDRFWSLFGNAFTVYGGCQINLSAATDPKIIASVIQLAAENQQDPVLANPDQLWNLALVVAKAHDLGFVFESTQDFADFVNDPVGTMSGMLATAAGKGGTAAGAGAALPGIPPGMKGVKLSPQLLSAIATAGPRRTYRVEAYGEVTRAQVDSSGKPIFPPVRRTLRGVWDTKTTPQNARPSPAGPAGAGAWVFLREE
jgi:hypothetical protein